MPLAIWMNCYWAGWRLSLYGPLQLNGSVDRNILHENQRDLCRQIVQHREKQFAFHWSTWNTSGRNACYRNAMEISSSTENQTSGPGLENGFEKTYFFKGF